LAQIGEFSFILAELGRMLDLLPGEGYSLVIAGALLSITLNPLLFRTIEPIEEWVRGRSSLARYTEWRAGSLAKLPAGENPVMRGHAVICGYGRVGSVVAEALTRRRFPYVVIEQNRRVVERLRANGDVALNGDASNEMLLERVNLAQARILIVALPDPPSTRLIVDYARRVNPKLDIVVRTHSRSEREHLYEKGTREVVIGELELALEMARHALHRFGLSSTEILAITQSLRLRQDDGPR
jgi:monovalent cation:H+ antiporter-2, CPA2 family